MRMQSQLLNISLSILIIVLLVKINQSLIKYLAQNQSKEIQKISKQIEYYQHLSIYQNIQMKFNYFLLQLLLVFNLAKARQQIENCISYLVVYMDPQNQQLTLICQECLEGYIVASDFQSCISNKNFLYDYKYCKRLDSNNQCDEGLCSIYIDQYGNFFSETEYYDPRCAKVDKINNICLRPRFPFTLVQDDNSFYYEDNYFCQIQNANKDCIKRYGGFQQQNGYKSFIMPINNNFPNQNCQISNCKRCGLINNLQELQYCQECQSNFYSNYNLLCDVNCIQDPVSQKCIYCILPDNILRVGDQCQNKLKEVPNCIKSNSIGVCIQCNEGYFYHIQNQACQERVASKQNCKLVNPISDQCLTPECQVGFSLSQQFENDFYYTQSQQYDSINVFLLPSEYLQKILQDPKQYKLQNQIISIDIPDNQDVKMIMQDFYYTNSINQMCVNTPNLIDGCIQYLGNLCVQCENNKIYYQYMPKTDSNGLFYKSYCGESQNLGVENCLLFKNNQCLKCIDTFYLDGGQCLQNPISNCMIIVKGSDGQTFQCSQCQKGYQYNSQLNSCVIIPKNCIDYQCSQCIDNINYQLNINTQQNTRSCFQIKQQQPQFEPCQQKTDGQCTQCNYGTLLQNGQCVLNQSPCLRFSDNKKCLECQANYTLFKGMCYYSDPLSYCNKSRYYQNSSGYVSKCDFNPNAYETENGPNCIENQNCKEGEYKDETGQCQQCKFNTPSRQIKKCYKNFSLDINAYYDEKTNQAWNELYNKYFPICLNGRHLINNNSVCSYNVQLKYPKIIKNQITQKYINQFPTSDDDISQEIQFDDKKNQYFCPQKVWLQQAWQDSLSKCQIQVQNFCYQGFVFEGGICQFKCGNGLISFSEDGCATSEQCQQGMQWQNELKTCIYLCGDGLVAFNNMSCATTTTCQMSDQNEKSPERCFNYIQINKSYTYSAGNSYGYLYALIAFLVIALLLSILYIRKLKQEQKIFKNTTVASTQQENKDTESNKESEPLNQKEIIYNNQDNLITIQVNQDDLPEIQSSNEDFRIESKIQRYNNQKTLINQIENKLKQDLEKQINNQFEIELPSDPSSQINFNGIPKYNLKPDHRYSQSSYIQNSNQHMKQKEELQRQHSLHLNLQFIDQKQK
ncbi:transmembrane protein, putative (macronuclear) [Tetrahymena thermophila SB210]|uniref:Transmembrane protein, putative n=1 Tax=Tetrahymena thermophila (strain SB210) TaxID=312017 RepID=W7XCS4_TETTS|nr:transmembrane protein, putative [Tetrahymena thermophila SB210]EWS74348.1 transmembrane protein, putative [Tetrahymena thermophila SB210]|eukprot:XP_012653108.1 transmembrane protein, putative [Tetrahymena thermophila SB210]